MTISEMKRIVTAGLPHYFKADTMRFFDSRIPQHVPRMLADGRIAFLTSERFDVEPRAYTVRIYDPASEDMSTDAQGYQGYRSLKAAQDALASL